MALPQTLLATQMNDLTVSSLRELGRARWTDLASPLQDHIIMKNLMRQKRVTFKSGTGVQFNVMVNYGGNAFNVSPMGSQDNVNVRDTMVQATMDWRGSVGAWGIFGPELDMNEGASRITDIMKERRIAAMGSLIELMENNGWGPPVGSTDNLTPWGLKTWFPKNASEGFNGGMPSGYTALGLSTTTYPAWKHWTYQYSAVSRDDFIRHLRKAADWTNFKPVVEGTPTFNTGDDYGLYCNYAVYGALAEILDASNEDYGDELDKYSGSIMFRRLPIIWTPKLEADTTNPLYGINWGVVKFFVLNNWWLRETHLPFYPGAHTMQANFLDFIYNLGVWDRRRNFVLATGTGEPS